MLNLIHTGLPRSGKKLWKMKNVPGHGKVREFQKKMLVNWLLVFHKLQAILEKECFLTSFSNIYGLRFFFKD